MNKRLRIWLRNFFGFSRTESNGFIILILLMAIFLFLPIISRQILNHFNLPIQTEEDKQRLTALLEEMEANGQSKKTYPKDKQNYKYFDLNTSDTTLLIEAGFPDFLARRIVKYREKVKEFDSKEELLKIYGIDSGFYLEIYPFIQLSKREENLKPKKAVAYEKIKEEIAEKEENKIAKRTVLQPFDLNQADSLKLQNIYGIGPAYSSRIIKYRSYLGGYYSLNQLSEVYGLKGENLDSLKKYVFIGKSPRLRKIHINSFEVDSLAKHPYVSYKQAKLLINYRKQHGDFLTIEDLISIKILDSSWVKKVYPYISFD